MNSKILKLVTFLFAILAPVLCKATTVDFYEDGTIQNGNIYDVIHSHNNAIVNVTGGQVSWFDAYESSTVNLSNGTVSLCFHIYDTSTLNVSGGSVESLSIYNSGVANLTGGQISYFLAAWDSTTVNIYGYGFQSNTEGNIYLSGYWSSGESFSIWLRGPETPSHVILHEIPEPATFLLLALGSLLLRKHK